jgi:hypothetical protein
MMSIARMRRPAVRPQQLLCARCGRRVLVYREPRMPTHEKWIAGCQADGCPIEFGRDSASAKTEYVLRGFAK